MENCSLIVINSVTLDDLSWVWRCGACCIVSHSPCCLSRPSSPPSLPPSTRPVLPPPRWELCNTLQGWQERGLKGALCVYVSVIEWCQKGMEKESIYEGKWKNNSGRLILIYKPSSRSFSFIHSHLLSHIFHSFVPLLIKVVDKDSLTTFSGLWLVFAAERGLKETAA